jgi:CHAT domain-containing protein
LLSLWRVEDASTAALMQTFYRYIFVPGVTRVAALRQAQLALLNGESGLADATYYRHPYFWAAFNLIGEAGIL